MGQHSSAPLTMFNAIFACLCLCVPWVPVHAYAADTRLCRDIGPGCAQAGMPREGGAAPFQTVEELVGRWRVVARDIEPDVQQIDFGLPRRANARQSFKSLRACA